MAAKLMNVQLSDHAQIGYSTMGTVERLHLDAWMGHLQRWRDDEQLRSKAQRLAGEEEETYSCYTGRNLYIAFTVSGDDLTIVSIFRKELLHAFEKMRQASAP